MNNGRITISKPTRGDGEDRIEISVKDNSSRNRSVNISMTLEDFAKALMGLAEVECEHKLIKPEIVGKIKEIETLEFEIPSTTTSDRKSVAAEIANREMPVGWELWDTFSSQKSFFSIGNTSMAKCKIIRYVDEN